LVIPELGARLERAGDDLVEADLLDAFPMFLGGDWCRNPRVDEGSKSFAQTFP